VNSVLSVPLHVDIPDKFLAKRTVKDYGKLNFLLSGTPTDGRKGQLIALSAFQRFIDTYYNKDPSKYRDFSVHFVSIAEDYVSTQIKTIGNVVLGKKLHLYPSLPRDEALEITKKCNAVICCSLNETFALYVAEGMMMGHVVLRNGSAGVDEQLVDGKNGYYIDSDDINQFAEVLERLLNKKSSSNETLYKMGEKSHTIATEYSKSKYLEFLN